MVCGPAATPADHFADAGLAYASRGNGFTYGWSADNTAWTRDRNSAKSSDQRYDTLCRMQGIWEIAVPNGSYDVYIVDVS